MQIITVADHDFPVTIKLYHYVLNPYPYPYLYNCFQLNQFRIFRGHLLQAIFYVSLKLILDGSFFQRFTIVYSFSFSIRNQTL